MEPLKAQSVCLGGGGSSNSERADSAIGDSKPITHFYALCDARLAERFSMPYGQLEGHVSNWHIDDGLRCFVDAAVTDLGLSTRHVGAVAGWMIDFQQRPVQGGVVLAEESAGMAHGVEVLTAECQESAGCVEQPQEAARQSALIGAGMVDGEPRVYTRPLDRDAARLEGIVRYAVNGVVQTVGVVRCGCSARCFAICRDQ
jgi:hypothetical protein